MPEILHQASDDQLALAFCFTAVATCGLIMYFSHHLGRLTGHIRMHQPEADMSHSMLASSHSPVIPATVRDKAA